MLFKHTIRFNASVRELAARLVSRVAHLPAHVKGKYSGLAALCGVFDCLHLTGDTSTMSAAGEADVEGAARAASEQCLLGGDVRSGAEAMFALHPSLVQLLIDSLLEDRSLGSQVAHLFEAFLRSWLRCTGEKNKSSALPFEHSLFTRFIRIFLKPILAPIRDGSPSLPARNRKAYPYLPAPLRETGDGDVDSVAEFGVSSNGRGVERPDALNDDGPEHTWQANNPFASAHNLVEFLVPKLVRLPKPWNEHAIFILLASILHVPPSRKGTRRAPEGGACWARVDVAESKQRISSPLTARELRAAICILKCAHTFGIPIPLQCELAIKCPTSAHAGVGPSCSSDVQGSPEWPRVADRVTALLEQAVQHADDQAPPFPPFLPSTLTIHSVPFSFSRLLHSLSFHSCI